MKTKLSVLLVFLTLAACKKEEAKPSEAPAPAAAPAPTAAPTAPAATGSTGSPECDDYLKTYEKFLTCLPEDQRAKLVEGNKVVLDNVRDLPNNHNEELRQNVIKGCVGGTEVMKANAPKDCKL
jgi:hypothetical protein